MASIFQLSILPRILQLLKVCSLFMAVYFAWLLLIGFPYIQFASWLYIVSLLAFVLIFFGIQRTHKKMYDAGIILAVLAGIPAVLFLGHLLYGLVFVICYFSVTDNETKAYFKSPSGAVDL